MMPGARYPHVALVQQDGDPGVGDSWSTRHERLPCRYYETDATVIGETSVETARLFVPKGSELSPNDRIYTVFNLAGTQLSGIKYVTAIDDSPRLHDEVTLEGVQGEDVEDARTYWYAGNRELGAGDGQFYHVPVPEMTE